MIGRCVDFWLGFGTKLMVVGMIVRAFHPASRGRKAVSRDSMSLIFGSNVHTFIPSSTAKRTSTTIFSSTKATRTLAPGSHSSELEVKKSRFIGYATHAENWDQALAYIEYVKGEHPKARHWCYGFQCGVNPVSERCSDDGEPTGTAGLPILGAIKGEELSDVVCVVVRYFGGIKLGAGGLIRAYGAASRKVLREAPVKVLIPKAIFRAVVMSENVGAIYDSVAKVGGVTSEEDYGEDGCLSLAISCNLGDADQLKESLTDATRGSVKFLAYEKEQG